MQTLRKKYRSGKITIILIFLVVFDTRVLLSYYNNVLYIYMVLPAIMGNRGEIRFLKSQVLFQDYYLKIFAGKSLVKNTDSWVFTAPSSVSLQTKSLI